MEAMPLEALEPQHAEQHSGQGSEAGEKDGANRLRARPFNDELGHGLVHLLQTRNQPFRQAFARL